MKVVSYTNWQFYSTRRCPAPISKKGWRTPDSVGDRTTAIQSVVSLITDSAIPAHELHPSRVQNSVPVLPTVRFSRETKEGINLWRSLIH